MKEINVRTHVPSLPLAADLPLPGADRAVEPFFKGGEWRFALNDGEYRVSDNVRYWSLVFEALRATAVGEKVVNSNGVVYTLSANAINVVHPNVANTAARDVLTAVHGDVVTLDSNGQAYWKNKSAGADEWEGFGSGTIGAVPPNPELDPADGVSSWVAESAYEVQRPAIGGTITAPSVGKMSTINIFTGDLVAPADAAAAGLTRGVYEGKEDVDYALFDMAPPAYLDAMTFVEFAGGNHPVALLSPKATWMNGKEDTAPFLTEMPNAGEVLKGTGRHDGAGGFTWEWTRWAGVPKLKKGGIYRFLKEGSVKNADIQTDYDDATLEEYSLVQTISYFNGKLYGGGSYYVVLGTATEDGGSVIQYDGFFLKGIFKQRVELAQFGSDLEAREDESGLFDAAQIYAKANGLDVFLNPGKHDIVNVDLLRGLRYYGIQDETFLYINPPTINAPRVNNDGWGLRAKNIDKVKLEDFRVFVYTGGEVNERGILLENTNGCTAKRVIVSGAKYGIHETISLTAVNDPTYLGEYKTVALLAAAHPATLPATNAASVAEVTATGTYWVINGAAWTDTNSHVNPNYVGEYADAVALEAAHAGASQNANAIAANKRTGTIWNIVGATWTDTTKEAAEGRGIGNNIIDCDVSGTRTYCVFIEGQTNPHVTGTTASKSRQADGFKTGTLFGRANSNPHIIDNYGIENFRDGFDLYNGCKGGIVSVNHALRNALQGFDIKNLNFTDESSIEVLYSGNVADGNGWNGFHFQLMKHAIAVGMVAINNGQSGVFINGGFGVQLIGGLCRRNKHHGILASGGGARHSIIGATTSDNGWTDGTTVIDPSNPADPINNPNNLSELAQVPTEAPAHDINKDYVADEEFLFTVPDTGSPWVTGDAVPVATGITANFAYIANRTAAAATDPIDETEFGLFKFVGIPATTITKFYDGIHIESPLVSTNTYIRVQGGWSFNSGDPTSRGNQRHGVYVAGSAGRNYIDVAAHFNLQEDVHAPDLSKIRPMTDEAMVRMFAGMGDYASDPLAAAGGIAKGMPYLDDGSMRVRRT